MNSSFFDDKLEKLQAELFVLPLIIAHKDKITRPFIDYTAKLTYDLNAYKKFFDLLDSKYADEPEEIKQSVQQALIETEGRKFMNFLDEKLGELEKIIIYFSKKDHERHGYYLRQQLWPFILCSPFMTRTNIKPRGYCGDSAMIKMIYDDRYAGSSTFGKLMHKHPIERPAAQAVRNRRDLVAKMLRALKSMDLKAASKIRVLSVACGPAIELQGVLTSTDDCARYHFTLLDQDKYALAEARSQIRRIERKLGQPIEADLINESVRMMPNLADLDQGGKNFDYIYSMGLFDYLTPPVAKAVIGKLYQMLDVGGQMVIGNFHISNASRYYMEYWLDWVLYHRSEQEFRDLSKNLESAVANIVFEDTGSLMLMQMKRYGP